MGHVLKRGDDLPATVYVALQAGSYECAVAFETGVLLLNVQELLNELEPLVTTGEARVLVPYLEELDPEDWICVD